MNDISSYYPNISQVRDFDKSLRTRWGINFFENVDAYHAQFKPIKKKMKQYFKESNRAVHKRQKDRSTHLDESKIMGLMADISLNAAVSSIRRHYILDSICLTSGLISRLSIKGEILDIGCHNGMLIDILARYHRNDFQGIDPVEKAVQTANSRTANLKNTSFFSASMPYESDNKFELVLCFDVLHHLDDDLIEKAISNIGELTAENGYAIVSTELFAQTDWLEKLAEYFNYARLGFEFCDVHGGYGDIPPHFEANTVVVFKKNGTKKVPSDLVNLSSAEWENHFKDYANDPATPPREKTQSFERANRLRRTN